MKVEKRIKKIERDIEKLKTQLANKKQPSLCPLCGGKATKSCYSDSICCQDFGLCGVMWAFMPRKSPTPYEVATNFSRACVKSGTVYSPSHLRAIKVIYFIGGKQVTKSQYLDGFE